jgi:hypothetical protein
VLVLNLPGFELPWDFSFPPCAAAAPVGFRTGIELMMAKYHKPEKTKKKKKKGGKGADKEDETKEAG